jgi:hypothetical protein
MWQDASRIIELHEMKKAFVFLCMGEFEKVVYIVWRKC